MTVLLIRANQTPELVLIPDRPTAAYLDTFLGGPTQLLRLTSDPVVFVM